jgi:NADP-dependent 3-hydroxy acid dehydrogenase YdfG
MSAEPEIRNVLITGAARGLGLLLARRLASEGYNICGTDLRFDLLDREMTLIRQKYDVQTLAVKSNISNEKQVSALVKNMIAQWGHIDVLINNAGIRKVAPINKIDEETWDEIQNSNLKGQFLCTREVLRQDMRKRNTGLIIFISSDAAKQGSANSSAYAASKWAGLGLSKSLEKDLKKTNIRTSTIVPGRMWTPMAEESEAADLDIDWLEPEYVVDTVMFCIKQPASVSIPEIQIYHRSQI